MSKSKIMPYNNSTLNNLYIYLLIKSVREFLFNDYYNYDSIKHFIHISSY